MKIGYARVSTEEQSLDLQIDALTRAGCGVIHRDHGISGAQFNRPGLDATIAALSRGDILVVWRLDRLGRSLARLIELIARLGDCGIEFISVTEAIDTTSAGGMLMFHMMAALAEFERRLISDRTRAGLDAARSRGVLLGRKRSLTPAQCAEALQLLAFQSLKLVASYYNVHPRTLQRLKKRDLLQGKGA